MLPKTKGPLLIVFITNITIIVKNGCAKDASRKVASCEFQLRVASFSCEFQLRVGSCEFQLRVAKYRESIKKSQLATRNSQLQLATF